MINAIQEKQEQVESVSRFMELNPTIDAAMTSFLEDYPHWDQDRLVNAALALFFMQNRPKSADQRSIERQYLNSVFAVSAPEMETGES